MVSHWLEDAKGRTRTALFVDVLCGPFRAQISSILLVGVGHCLRLFVLIVALIVALDLYVAEEGLEVLRSWMFLVVLPVACSGGSCSSLFAVVR